ncbi:MAG: rRNA methyltransferase [Deltaproteobacteria bacterium]|nr:rRNA methyltransferase [Deltaproteobacteria bacterium]
MKDAKAPHRPVRKLRRGGEALVYGLHAVLAVFRHRPLDVVRLYITPERARSQGPLLKRCAAQRLAYHLVPTEELGRVTSSTHHEGIAALVRQPPPEAAERWLAAQPGSGRSILVALEGTENPHNAGSILRAAAHFGAAALCVDDAGPATTPAARRTAEGGAEHVEILVFRSARGLAEAARGRGYGVVATSSHADRGLSDVPLGPRTLVLLGGEGPGLSPEALAAADLCVAIPGTGAVESLNVGHAAAILLAEWWRRNPPA